jgi:hypothetical protein
MLVVRLKTRLDPTLFELVPGREIDGTFLLNGAIMSALAEGENGKRVDFNLLGWDQNIKNRSQVKTLLVIS